MSRTSRNGRHHSYRVFTRKRELTTVPQLRESLENDSDEETEDSNDEEEEEEAEESEGFEEIHKGGPPDSDEE